MVQSMPQSPVPREPQAVVHETVRPMAQSNPSSTAPSQLSSRPLHVSLAEVGTHSVSQAPSPSRSDHPSWQRMVQTLDSHTGSAFRPAEQMMPQPPQFMMSASMSAQAPSHAIVPGGHSSLQPPSLQTSKGSHSLSQVPQWL